VLAAGLEVLQDRDVFALVPDHQVALASALKDAAFEPVSRYAAMAKRLARTVEEPTPEHAGEAVPVS
jgi:hypothetical protein